MTPPPPWFVGARTEVARRTDATAGTRRSRGAAGRCRSRGSDGTFACSLTSASSRNFSVRRQRLVDACSRSRSVRSATASRGCRSTLTRTRGGLRRRRRAGVSTRSSSTRARSRLPRTSTSASPIVQRLDDALETERADEHAIADRRRASRSRRRSGCGRSAGRRPPQPLADRVDAARASARAAPVSPVGISRAAPALRFGRKRVGPGLQRVDDRVDLAARVAQPLVDPLIEPLAERLLAVAQLLLARRAAWPRVSVERLALARASRCSCSSACMSRSTFARCSASCVSRALRCARACSMIARASRAGSRSRARGCCRAIRSSAGRSARRSRD